MAWEALTAISSLLSMLIIGVTAVVAIIQIRHIRAAAQLQGFLDLLTESSGSRLGQANTYIEKVLPKRLQDAEYRRELADGQFDTESHPELVVGAFWEKLGTLISFDYLDSTLFIDFVAAICPHQWELLKEVADLRRQKNPRAWERFDSLAARCRAYESQRDRSKAAQPRY